MLQSTRPAPSIPTGPRSSRRKIQPRTAALTGLRAQKRPAFSALMWPWAMGCRVRPKPVQTSASITMPPQPPSVVGRCGVSVRRDMVRARTPTVPTWTRPRARVSSSRAKREVRRIVLA